MRKTTEATNQQPEVAPEKPVFNYVASIAGYMTELPNGDVIASKYEYANGPMILVLRPTSDGKNLVEIHRQPSMGVQEGQKQIWQIYQERFKNNNPPASD
jgi:hypothetical protein